MSLRFLGLFNLFPCVLVNLCVLQPYETMVMIIERPRPFLATSSPIIHRHTLLTHSSFLLNSSEHKSLACASFRMPLHHRLLHRSRIIWCKIKPGQKAKLSCYILRGGGFSITFALKAHSSSCNQGLLELAKKFVWSLYIGHSPQTFSGLSTLIHSSSQSRYPRTSYLFSDLSVFYTVFASRLTNHIFLLDVF